jgi:hypothetical protein
MSEFLRGRFRFHCSAGCKQFVLGESEQGVLRWRRPLRMGFCLNFDRVRRSITSRGRSTIGLLEVPPIAADWF